jgi:hypothetical protein
MVVLCDEVTISGACVIAGWRVLGAVAAARFARWRSAAATQIKAVLSGSAGSQQWLLTKWAMKMSGESRGQTAEGAGWRRRAGSKKVELAHSLARLKIYAVATASTSYAW